MHPDTTEGVVADVWKFFDRLNAGDVRGALDCFAATATWWIQSTGEVLPISEFAQALTDSMHESPRTYRLTAAHTTGRTVIFEIACRGQVVATQKPWVSDSCFVVIAGADGRLTSVREYFDTQRIAWATTPD
jgi:ketosteroid isomerase-like protein